MHSRYRSPGGGYRSSGSTGTSRISSLDSSSGRGQGGFYNSEYRSFNNRGFGRGQGHQKTFQQLQPPPPPPAPPKGDIFMEAGRLAVEYLVSRGLLPQSALSGKWQNGSLKKQVADYQDFKQQEDAQEGRTSVHARLGTSSSDLGSGRRRYMDDFNSRNHLKGRRRSDYHRNYSSERGREIGRSGQWQDRNRVSPETEGENDSVSGHYEEPQQVFKDANNEMQKSGPSGLTPENQETDAQSGHETYSYQDEMSSKPSSISSEKDETDGELSKGSVDLLNLNSINGETKDSTISDESIKQIVLENITTQGSALEGEPSGNRPSDLLSLCKFVKVPTKTRSALTNRASKGDQAPENDRESAASDMLLPKGNENLDQDTNLGTSDSPADLQANSSSAKHSQSETSKAVSFQLTKDLDELGLTYGQDKCVRSLSFQDRAFMHNSEQESSEGLPLFGRSTSVKERGEKRATEDSDMGEAAKKTREWIPSLVSRADNYAHPAHYPSNLSVKRESSLNERALPEKQLVGPIPEENLVDKCPTAEAGGEHVNYVQDDRLFSSSFKLCDLNLMEASDMNENHNNDSVCMYPSIMTSPQEASQVDVDLSISNSNPPHEFARCAPDGKEIEVIDLENDCSPENQAFDHSQRKVETAFTSSEGFASHAQNAGDINDVPDNYDGLIMSEFLTSFPNCTSAAEDINPLQNEIGIHNGEGTLGDDDSIYMSLEEIPLSFIPAWEQPTPQEYEKPF